MVVHRTHDRQLLLQRHYHYQKETAFSSCLRRSMITMAQNRFLVMQSQKYNTENTDFRNLSSYAHGILPVTALPTTAATFINYQSPTPITFEAPLLILTTKANTKKRKIRTFL